ncbi:F0F1 ATP synthase subunit C [Candidatus Liberibacter sp.]|uniref:F0F1 ATP synthase subunit C n=1 Tax=Candidatus Liberibacter sp. TaxID=34022 RepID=UPI0015F55D52|nr:F0F1 ATP synthase subunit C [Candidatus Liberibacter sp.]MBA5724486.1 ATPase [Candidatus Liberibacter sp.]
MEQETVLTAVNYYAQASKYFAIGSASIGLGLVALALGSVFRSYLLGALRNPSAAGEQKVSVLIFAAITESVGIFLLLVIMLLIFVS